MKVGPFEFSVESDSALGDLGAAGLCVYDHAAIILDPTLDGVMVRDSLLHEVMHAIWKLTSLRVRVPDEAPDSLGEHIIQDVTTALLCVLRDNPAVVAWLLEQV